MSQLGANPRGSIWHRWDPHIHAPGTLLNDQFANDWDTYLASIEGAQPVVRALGITDYFCIDAYWEARRHKLAGRLADVELLFPNVELRLDIKTAKQKGVNLHLLFSPDDPHHESQIARALDHLQFEYRGTPYRCTPSDLSLLGRAFDPSQTDDARARKVGANQFKVTLPQLRNMFRSERWLARNCLVAVAAGQEDGTAGLQSDDSYAATREEIERFSHIIFSGNPRTRQFWLGQIPEFPVKLIEAKYGFLKPCLHGSDAHASEQVGAPTLDRYCWIKGDLTFETLRQAVIEPERRVWVGQAAPLAPAPSITVDEFRSTNADWISTPLLELNPGLITVIGARGSGKTALLDMIAAATGSIHGDQGPSSFLKRAAAPIDLLGDAMVSIVWGDGERSSRPLGATLDDGAENRDASATYLSQHFVERLCSATGPASELKAEMERVVFESTDPTDRLGASSFAELLEAMLDPILRHRSEIEEVIQTIGDEIVEEDELRAKESGLKTEADRLNKGIAASQKVLVSILPKDKEVHARRLSEIEAACTTVANQVEEIKRRLKLVDDLRYEITNLSEVVEPRRLSDLKLRYMGLGLSTDDWNSFGMQFLGDAKSVLWREQKALEKAVQKALNGDPDIEVDLKTIPLARWPLGPLRAERELAKKAVGLDADRQKKYEELQRSIAKQDATLKSLRIALHKAAGAKERRDRKILERRRSYSELIRTICSEEEALKNLYASLAVLLRSAGGVVTKLSFVVRRQADLKTWVASGESLLDLRKDSAFRGKGTLAAEAQTRLLPAWERGTVGDVDVAMDQFRSAFQDEFLKAQPTFADETQDRRWIQNLASWLYSTSHISVNYAIEYDGVSIEQLSPGTRGIVLLLLYLAVDQNDMRPLLIDQPEENLDPKSVFDDLVPHFRFAAKRRQVIIVTHNANLVVNTDADQVVVAEARSRGAAQLPQLTYTSGGLENGGIREQVCRILEGGERAFLERARRYRLDIGENITGE